MGWRDYDVVMPGEQRQYFPSEDIWRSYPISRAKFFYRESNGFPRVKPKGTFIPPTDYSVREVSHQESLGSVSFQLADGTVNSHVSGYSVTNYTTGDMVNALLQETDMPGSFPSELVAQSQAKAWSNLKTSNVNLGQNYAERGQTAKLVTDSLKRMAGGLRKLRRDPRVLKDIANGANKLVKDLPNHWLEVVFGWQPLVSDIHGAITELDSRDDSHWKVTAKGSSKRRGEYHGIFVPGLSGGNPLYSDKSDVEFTMDYGCFTRIDASPSSAALVKAAQLGLTNPLSLAWELLPWSFAIDWCFPLGQYFDNLDAPLGWDILGMSTSRYQKRRLRRRGLSHTMPDGAYYTSNYSARQDVTQVDRGTTVTLPFEIAPQLKDPFSSAKRVGTMLSLLGQLIGRF